MLQIIGLLGCVYLAVKGVEMVVVVAVSPRADKNAATIAAVLTLLVCWIVAALGAALLLLQGESMPSPP